MADIRKLGTKLTSAIAKAGEKASAAKQALGRGLLVFAPWLMKALSVVGTLAMFLVGGGILTHGVPWLHHAIEGLTAGAGMVAGLLVPLLADALVGVAAGIVVLAGVMGVQRLRGGKPAH